MQMKVLHRTDLYISKHFLLNFLLCFSLSMIVLILNAVWLYIDVLVGKGIDFFVVSELFTNLIIKLIPKATSIGINQAKSGLISVIAGVWAPIFLLLSIAILLTFFTNKDLSFPSLYYISNPLKKLFSFVKKA